MTTLLIFVATVISGLGVIYSIVVRRPRRCAAMICGGMLLCWREHEYGSWFCHKHIDYMNDPEEGSERTSYDTQDN